MKGETLRQLLFNTDFKPVRDLAVKWIKVLDFGANNWKMITFLKHMCSIDPPVREAVWQALWAHNQRPALIKNRHSGLSFIILSFGKYAQAFLFTSHMQLRSHSVLKTHAHHGQTATLMWEPALILGRQIAHKAPFCVSRPQRLIRLLQRKSLNVIMRRSQ